MKKYFGVFKVVSVLLLFISICLCVYTVISNEISSYQEEKIQSKIVKEVISPNGRYRALIIDNSYGATTYFSYQLLLLETDEKLTQDDDSIVFICDEIFDFGWEDEKLIITNCEGKVYKNVKSAKGIEVIVTE